MRTHKIEYAPMVRLGEYIERSMVNNSDLKYGPELIEGVNSSGEFCKTKADLLDINLKPYKLVNNGDFVYNPSRFNIGSIAFRTQGFCIVSHLYVVFRLNELGKQKIDPFFLYMYIYRKEFFRMITYLNFGSQRPEFNFFELSEIKIPLPSIETQKELVAVYNGLKELAEENEKLLEPLSKSCQAFIVDCKNKYESKLLKNYIEEVNERNINNEISLTQGVDVNMQFIPAKREAENKEGTKIVRTGQFAFNKVVKAGGTKLPIAFRTGPDCIISSSYAVFKNINTEELLSEYLMLWMSRSEFHRYCGFMSQGTTRDVFDFSDLSSLKIPVPPMDIQQKIVDLYNCYEECKRISTEAREKIKNLCPALVQKAVNSN